jgi:transcriptional regulator with XRE-family HTH domain
VFDKGGAIKRMSHHERAMKSGSSLSPTERRKRSRVLDAEVGQAIRFHHKGAKLTLQGLADRLGIAYQQVQKYETGVNRVGAGRLMEIAQILEIPVANFFEAATPGEKTTPDTESTVQGRQLLVWFMRIKDPNKRKMLLDYARSVADGEAA